MYGICFLNCEQHCESEETEPFSLEHNLSKYCPVLIIFTLLQSEIICPQNVIEFAISPIVFCWITLKNATTYTSSQKLWNKSACYKAANYDDISYCFHDVIMQLYWRHSMFEHQYIQPYNQVGWYTGQWSVIN